MTECNHRWILARAKQFHWEEQTYGEKRGLFGHTKSVVVESSPAYGRADEYFCSLCLDEKTVVRKQCDSLSEPKWWSHLLDHEYSPYGRPGAMEDMD